MKTSNPDERPPVSSDLFALAARFNKKIVQVMLDREGGPATGPIQNFMTLLDFLPRIGETILTHDGHRCRVDDVMHKIATTEDKEGRKAFDLFPVVIAMLIEPKNKSE